MKKIIFIIVSCIFVIAVTLAIRNKDVNRPFKDLKASDIASASVRLLPPDTTIPIEQTEELVKLLNKVVIYQEDNSYGEYNGQAVIFTLSLSDGKQLEVMEYNPFLVIDGIGYKTKYGPCEALNRYANRLLDS